MNPFDLSLIATADPPAGDPSSADQPPPPTQQPTQSVVEDTEDDSGGCGGKGCCGCGCAAVVGVVLLLVIGTGYTFWQAPRAIGADDWGETAEIFSGLHQLASGASEGFSRDPQELTLPGAGDDEDPEEIADGLDGFFDSMEDTEISRGDIRGIHVHMKEWEDNETVAEFKDTFERLEELEDDDSFWTAMRAMRSLYSLFFRAAELGQEYNAHLDELDDEQRRQHQQLMAIIRAAQMSTSSGHDPWDQEVADNLLQDHDEHQEEYRTARHVFREAMTDPDFDPEELDEREQRELAEAFGNQFLMITSAINRDSLEAWAALDEEERQELIEDIDAPHNLVARYIGGILLAEEGEPHEFYVRLAGL